MSKWTSEFMKNSQRMYSISQAMVHLQMTMNTAKHLGDTAELSEQLNRYLELELELFKEQGKLKELIKDRCHA